MAKLYLFCDTCRNQEIQHIPDDVLDGFGTNQETRTTRIKEWLKKQGIVCECGEEFAIIDVTR